MITLYIKTHNKTGLKYFGRTINEDYESYTGSGTRWLNHIKKHGYDVTTEVYKQYEDICFGLIRDALRFSRNNNIVHDNKKWANLKEENGLAWGGKDVYFSDERRKNHSKGQKGISLNKAVFIDENGEKTKIDVSEAKERGLIAESKGRKYSDEVNKKKGKSGELNSMFNKKHSKETLEKIGSKSRNMVTCFDLETGERLRISKDIFDNSERYVGSSSRKIKEYYENKKD